MNPTTMPLASTTGQRSTHGFVFTRGIEMGPSEIFNRRVESLSPAQRDIVAAHEACKPSFSSTTG